MMKSTVNHVKMAGIMPVVYDLDLDLNLNYTWERNF
jgi:hypothetical protein